MRENENLDLQAKKFFIMEKKINIFSSFLLIALIAILIGNTFVIMKRLKNIEYNIYILDNKK